MNVFVGILSYVIGLVVLYIVIETAVRRGIHNSVIGQALEKKEDIIF